MKQRNNETGSLQYSVQNRVGWAELIDCVKAKYFHPKVLKQVKQESITPD